MLENQNFNRLEKNMDLVSIISAVAACFAALYAARSSKLAKQAYSLALEQDQRNRPSLELYLVNSYIKRIENADERIFVFRLMITNKSASRNSIKGIQLLIEYQRREGPTSNVSIPHNADLISTIHENEDPFKIPFNIDHYSAIGGLAIFKVPNEVVRGSSVETYLVRIIDNEDNETELEAILLKEIDNEKVAKEGNTDKQ
jgi:hypothetical protein